MSIPRRAMLAGAGALALRGQAPERKLKLAFIGTGHRTWAHIQVLKAIPDFEVVALADPTPEFRDRAASLVGQGVKTYASYQEMLAREKDLDGVVVVTPNFLHAEAAVAALSSGRHVLCEKPMATSVEEANSMIAAAEKAGKTLQIGLQMRYDPLYTKLAEIVAAGRIGTVQYVSGNLFRGDWNPKSWRYTDPRTGTATNWRFLTRTAGSSLMEDGIHEIDVLNWMIGSRVTRVYATGGNNVLKDRETIDHAGVLVDYENGVKFAFEFCIFAPNSGPASRRMALIGTEGNIQVAQNKIVLRGKTGAAQDIEVAERAPKTIGARQVGPDQDIGTYRQYLAFARSIRTGEKPFCGGQSSKEVLKISLLAEKSLREKRIMRWSDLPA
ncbi:MAG: Gfo/Idh/MocA family protein [Bryobacteraceae bacterium]